MSVFKDLISKQTFADSDGSVRIVKLLLIKIPDHLLPSLKCTSKLFL